MVDNYYARMYNSNCQMTQLSLTLVKHSKGTKMTAQTFKVVGITVHGDSTKVRFTDDMVRRIKQFTKGGATRCDFIELPNEMTKIEALKYMAQHADFQSPADQATIADCITDREKEATKGTVKVKATKAKPSIEAIKARGKKKEVEVDAVDATELHNVDPA